MASCHFDLGKRMNRGKYGQLPSVRLSICMVEHKELVVLETDGSRLRVFLPGSPKELIDW